MKRVLVTGATGFIGRQCLEPLRVRGFDVHAVARTPGAPMDGVTWHACDLLDGARAGALVAEVAPTHLVHMAWYAVPGLYWTARENLSWVRASLALYEAFVAAGGTRFVGGGTCGEYDWSGDGVCREGVTPIAPRTYYGASKDALHRVIAADAAKAGVNAAWARFFFLFGEHEYPQRLVSSVILSLLRGEVAKCSPGTQARDFLHVADAGAAIAALTDCIVTGPVNIASGEAVTVRALVERTAELVGGDEARARLDFGARAADPTEPPLLVGDVARLRDEVGFTPAHDRDERLRQTIAWWRAHGAGA